ncbi:DUF1819 family protein [Acinetobacter baumannii]|uniref:DUF1819 family protein n=1 Tax=Acinetobacter calcoaceticus/baumannii complex TaxID=909768 RepID=UPI00028BEDF5|nr:MULTISPECIES: DUF1819 family protein [Acinetobacter calcoaceticus/baumannii complex]AIY37245.1 inner membrane protein, PF08849 family [Acinetobacter baumannii LAC-4]AKQ31367.1 membrane protein [Acinetobacter baumannii]APO59258.1 hypothetical protein BBX32_12235 [Acinetobacter baumannii]ARG38472.1 hypothetical protein B7L35_06270 [Acinetobacter baumannii]EHU1403280.1 DUF1819 family protein [Acinetobacter baumannii]
MLEQFHYDSDLIGGSLMVRESRLIADLLLREATTEQWHQAIQVDNILQKRTAASAQRNATAIRKRLERLEPDFWKALRDGDDELATQVAFCGALERNLLLLEFMETVMREAYISQAQYLDSYIWSDFLEERTQRDLDICEWKESSKKKMGQVVFRMLTEAGYLKSTRKLELQRVIVRAELRSLLEEHYKQRIKRSMEVSLWMR